MSANSGIAGLIDRTRTNAGLVDRSTGSEHAGERRLEILQERGWKGWTRIERVPAEVGE